MLPDASFAVQSPTRPLLGATEASQVGLGPGAGVDVCEPALGAGAGVGEPGLGPGAGVAGGGLSDPQIGAYLLLAAPVL